MVVCIHIMEYYSAMKQNKLLIPATTYMNCQATVLGRKENQYQNVYLQLCTNLEVKLMKWRLIVFRGWGQGLEGPRLVRSRAVVDTKE